MRPLLALTLVFCLATVVFAQKSETPSQGSTAKVKKMDFSVMPFMSYNRNLKFMIGAIPMAMYRPNPADTISPKSLSGLAAVYTTNNSYFISFFNKIYLAKDRWRLVAFSMTGDQNSQFFMDDMEEPGFYNYGTKTTFIAVEAQRRIIPHLDGGLTYSYAHHHTEYEDDIQPQAQCRPMDCSSTDSMIRATRVLSAFGDQDFPEVDQLPDLVWQRRKSPKDII